MADRAVITPELCRQLLRYDPETGKLFWKWRGVEHFNDARSQKIWNTRYAGQEAFTAVSRGYHVGRIFDKGFFAHRIGWTIVHGEWPRCGYDIDHINGNRSDNRLSNLRCVTHAVNGQNTKKPSHNTSGTIGVGFRKDCGKWEAYIGCGPTRKKLGVYGTKSEAVLARQAAEQERGYHQNHGRS